jgi:magnesium transporter
VGLLSLRALVRAAPAQRLGDIMIREPITVRVDTDQQDVARLIAKYDFLAMPVLDREGFLAGIITIDDVVDVLVAEFNEDIARLVGTDAEEMERRTPVQVARLRLPWLLGTMVIELMAGGVIARYDYVLKEVILLASFMPVISAISGNVGLQAAAIIVRGLDTGHVSVANMGRAVRKEAVTALLMALVCGLTLGAVGVIWSRHLFFGLVIGGAMTASMLTASLMGTVIPMLSKRLGFDPATTAGPFETAFQDVIGFGVFLWLASLLLPWLK